MASQKVLSNIKIMVILMSLPLVSEAGLRILGGRNALRNEFPFAIRLEQQYTERTNGETQVTYYQICTGAALSSSWILTAAHCDDDNMLKIDHKVLITSKPPIFARYNSHFPKQLGHLSPITKVVTHPGYLFSNDMGKYDIALFRTDNIIVSEYGKISSIDYMTLIGHEAVVLGFGRTNATTEGKPLQVLKGMMTSCNKIEGTYYGFLCVVPPCGLEATVCGGDSGGPVVHASGIIGVTSASFGNCDEFGHELYPGYAADAVSIISPLVDWVSNVIY